jgi:hypothetical protein
MVLSPCLGPIPSSSIVSRIPALGRKPKFRLRQRPGRRTSHTPHVNGTLRFSFYALDENDGGVIKESRPEIPAKGRFALRLQTRSIPVNFAEPGRAERLLMRSDIQVMILDVEGTVFKMESPDSCALCFFEPSLRRCHVVVTYSGGQSHHRHPLFRTCRMPLITRLSSTRSLPRTSLGKCGSIRHHCSSLSQNKLPRIFPLQNHQSRESATNSHIKTFIEF